MTECSPPYPSCTKGSAQTSHRANPRWNYRLDRLAPVYWQHASLPIVLYGRQCYISTQLHHILRDVSSCLVLIWYSDSPQNVSLGDLRLVMLQQFWRWLQHMHDTPIMMHSRTGATHALPESGSLGALRATWKPGVREVARGFPARPKPCE